jgi:hypothetical protein
VRPIPRRNGSGKFAPSKWSKEQFGKLPYSRLTLVFSVNRQGSRELVERIKRAQWWIGLDWTITARLAADAIAGYRR